MIDVGQWVIGIIVVWNLLNFLGKVVNIFTLPIRIGVLVFIGYFLFHFVT